MGQRSIDVAPPTTSSDRPATVAFSLSKAFRGIAGITVELLGTGIKTTTTAGGLVYLLEGLRPGVIYTARATLPDGRFEDHYLRVRCRDTCVDTRFLDIGNSYKPLPPARGRR